MLDTSLNIDFALTMTTEADLQIMTLDHDE